MALERKQKGFAIVMEYCYANSIFDSNFQAPTFTTQVLGHQSVVLTWRNLFFVNRSKLKNWTSAIDHIQVLQDVRGLLMKAMESFESSMNVEHYKAMRFRIDAELMMTFARKVYGLKKRKGKAMENAFDEMLKERPDLFSSDGYSGTAVMALRRNVKLALSNLGEMSLEQIFDKYNVLVFQRELMRYLNAIEDMILGPCKLDRILDTCGPCKESTSMFTGSSLKNLFSRSKHDWDAQSSSISIEHENYCIGQSSMSNGDQQTWERALPQASSNVTESDDDFINESEYQPSSKRKRTSSGTSSSANKSKSKTSRSNDSLLSSEKKKQTSKRSSPNLASRLHNPRFEPFEPTKSSPSKSQIPIVKITRTRSVSPERKPTTTTTRNATSPRKLRSPPRYKKNISTPPSTAPRRSNRELTKKSSITNNYMEDIETSDEEEPKHGHDSAFVANSTNSSIDLANENISQEKNRDDDQRTNDAAAVARCLEMSHSSVSSETVDEPAEFLNAPSSAGHTPFNSPSRQSNLSEHSQLPQTQVESQTQFSYPVSPPQARSSPIHFNPRGTRTYTSEQALTLQNRENARLTPIRTRQFNAPNSGGERIEFDSQVPSSPIHIKTSPTKTSSSGGRRLWTKEEENALTQGLKEFPSDSKCRWKDIKGKYSEELARRSTVQIKDKFRTMNPKPDARGKSS